MVSYGMLHREALVRSSVSDELRASFISVTRIDELGTTKAATSKRCTLRRNTKWNILVFHRSVRRLLVTASVVPSSQIPVTVIKEALSSSKSRLLQQPHGVTTQKTPNFIVTAVKTSSLTY
jgi:hypothetical protein